MNDNLEQLFADVIAHDEELAQKKAAKIAEEQKKYEAQQLAKKKAQQKVNLDKSLLNAIKYDDITKVKEVLEQGADLSYLDKGLDDRDKPFRSKDYAAYSYCCDFANFVHSAEMTQFLLSNVMDMKNPKHRDVAQKMLEGAFFKDEKSADKFIQLAKDNAFSLDGIMKNVVCRSQDIVGTYSKLIQAGAHQKDFDFESLARTYDANKNGHWGGREGDIWIDPDPERAAQIKPLLLKLIDAGYELDIKTSSAQYNFAKELAYEHAYEKFSEQDKKLVTDLKNDNIAEVRNTLNRGRLPDNVVQYMERVPDKKGKFFKYYQEVIHSDNKEAQPFAFADCERLYLEKISLNEAIDAAQFKPDGIEHIVTDKFCNEFAHKNRDFFETMNLADKFGKMTPDCKKAVSEKLVPILDEKLNKEKSFDSHIGELLAFSLKIYDASEESGKNALRLTMLKFRTSGNNEERREKAELYQKALNYRRMDNVKKDETIKAVSSVSYTPLSSLNRQLMKHGKELRDR